MLNNDFTTYGMVYFTDTVKGGRSSVYSNTYVVSLPGRDYIIDTSCGRKRLAELTEYFRNRGNYSILCTHYHNDHIANNGRLAGADRKIIYHENAKKKVSYLRTNGTGQILRMYRDMQKEGFLKRLGFFHDLFIRLLLKRKIYSKIIAEPLLFLISYSVSLKTIGRIYSGKRYVNYLEKPDRISLPLNGLDAEGWRIDDGLYALEAPGHTDCHIIFYVQKSKILLAGDALNFLTPNDIQFGELHSTIATQKFLLELAIKEKIEILCQGHYPPITGNEAVINHITEIIEKHEYVHSRLSSYVKEKSHGLSFDELYAQICTIDDPVIKKLARITFPRSTLVFLDVYLLKVIEEAGEESRM